MNLPDLFSKVHLWIRRGASVGGEVFCLVVASMLNFFQWSLPMVVRSDRHRGKEIKPQRRHDFKTNLAFESKAVQEAAHAKDILNIVLVVSQGDLIGLRN